MKIVIIGGGNAGVWTALHYGYWTHSNKDVEVELIYDPELDTFPVGQGTLLSAPELLWLACGADWYNNEMRATPKLGILYENFSKKSGNIFHPFPFHFIAMQADPKHLQKYILNSGLFSVREGNVTDIDTVDADVIFDCRGNFDKDDIEYESLYCPVNSVLLAVGPSPPKPQLWTRHIATPDGWTFVIPNTTDSTSYGYLYNKDITSLETAKTNFSELFPEASESYSGHFEHRDEVINLPFESYIAKTPLRIDSNGRKIIFNGNRLGFIEPMETTAIGFYLDMARISFDWIFAKPNIQHGLRQIDRDKFIINDASYKINDLMHQIHTFILWHYVKGSVYDTPFWRTAQEKAIAFHEQPNLDFQNIINIIKDHDYMACRNWHDSMGGFPNYGQWSIHSIKVWYDKYILAKKT